MKQSVVPLSPLLSLWRSHSPDGYTWPTMAIWWINPAVAEIMDTDMTEKGMSEYDILLMKHKKERKEIQGE